MKHLTRLLTALCLTAPFIAPVAAFAGSGSSDLRCASDSNRTQVYGILQDLRSPDWIQFTIDGHTVEMNRNDRVGSMDGQALVNLDYKVFTLSASKTWPGEGDFVFMELIADPQSMRIANLSAAIRMEFRAEVVGTEPRPNQASVRSKNIKVNCTLVYQKP